MESQGVVKHILNSLDDVKRGRFSDKSILDIADEKEA
jgi:hypothetical protein